MVKSSLRTWPGLCWRCGQTRGKAQRDRPDSGFTQEVKLGWVVYPGNDILSRGNSASCAKAQRCAEELTPVRDSWLQHSEQLFGDDEGWHQAGKVDLKRQCPTPGPAGGSPRAFGG